ncbi:MAG: hypothetical protein K6G81_01975 [Lachnospiraceae bacterium]|nr:hypothetical protein [Lachnospiraceae bacterium]
MSNVTDTSPLSSSFRYKAVYEKGKPVHGDRDDFSAKHPPMDLSRRAKIFSPFDALKGFSDELARAENTVSGIFNQVENDDIIDSDQP